MNFWYLIIGLGLAFVLQIVFSMFQLKDFSENFRRLRKMGRVAIGRKKGGFKAGSIVMVAIDEKGEILQGSYVCGVTILAKFKNLKGFEGKNIEELSEQDALSYPKQVRKAILNASDNYKTITRGGEVAEPLSPFGQMANSIGNFKTKNKKQMEV